MTHPLILFDGICGLCNWWVDFVLRRDPHGLFRFSPLQSDAARALLIEHGIAPDFNASIVLVADGRALVRSDAIVEILRRLGAPWSAAVVGLVVPRPLRDRAYDAVAARRYRWFGTLDACRLPTPSERARFL